MAVETRRLVAHDKLLLDVIKRQAGTVEKAILEAAMNGVEAAASRHEGRVTFPVPPRIDITLDIEGIAYNAPGAKLRIVDNGRGIKTRQELLDHFEKFGTPHEDSEGKIYAQFRMGRGQLFSFGKNTWRTSTFQMDVDIDGRGLDYDLQEGLPGVVGCDITVDLYRNPIGAWNLRTVDVLKGQIKKQIEFMPGVITFNGERLNTPVTEFAWTYEDENAYYLFGAGAQLEIYNLGAYVMSMSPTQAGVTGVVVSKNQLKVNFARNDIMSECPVWQGIQEVIKDNRVQKTRQAQRRLDRDERIATLTDLRDGIQTYDQIKTLGLFQTTSGKVLKFADIRNNTLLWSFHKSNDMIADKLMQSGQALVIDQAVLSELGYSGAPADFFMWLVRKGNGPANHYDMVGKLYRPYADLRKGLKEEFRIIPDQNLTTFERRLIKVLTNYNMWGGRRILIGTSDSANGWTDGVSYIAINRDFLERTSLSLYDGAARIAGLLAHEMAHDNDSAGSHVHGEEFYYAFHEICRRSSRNPFSIVGDIVQKMKNTRQEDYQEMLERREQKAKERRDAALRKAQRKAESKRRETVSVAADVSVTVVPAPTVVPPISPVTGKKMPRNLW